MAVQTGHFQYESGHQGDTWLTILRVIGALLVLGPLAGELAACHGLMLESLAFLETTLRDPANCPLSAAGTALSRVSDHDAAGRQSLRALVDAS